MEILQNFVAFLEYMDFIKTLSGDALLFNLIILQDKERLQE